MCMWIIYNDSHWGNASQWLFVLYDSFPRLAAGLGGCVYYWLPSNSTSTKTGSEKKKKKTVAASDWRNTVSINFVLYLWREKKKKTFATTHVFREAFLKTIWVLPILKHSKRKAGCLNKLLVCVGKVIYGLYLSNCTSCVSAPSQYFGYYLEQWRPEEVGS